MVCALGTVSIVGCFSQFLTRPYDGDALIAATAAPIACIVKTILQIIVLMIVFSWPEGFEISDFRHNRIGQNAGGFQLGF